METQIFEDIVHLLQGVDWLYNYPMTQVFTRDIFSHMPMEWQGALTDLPLDVLNSLPQCLTMQHWPPSLQNFLKECDRLSYLSQDLGPQASYRSTTSSTSYNSKTSSLQIPQELTLGLTAKKKHEITTLLGVVKKILDLTGSRHILDVGSGKGYIDSCIHRILHAQVCGVEGSKQLMRSAEKHHWKLYGRCRGITFLNWHLSDDVETVCRVGQLVSYLAELDPTCSCQTKPQGRTRRMKGATKSESMDNLDEGESVGVCEGEAANTEDRNSPHSQGVSESPSFCGNKDPESPCTLLGLHACADLSPIAIKVFKDCSQASSLILLSCCYHKMSVHPKAADRPVNDVQEGTPKSSDDLEEDAERFSHKMSAGPTATDRPVNADEVLTPMNSDDKEENEHSTKRDPTQNEGFVSEGKDFVNFPMSQSLQEIFIRNNFHMSVFGLRLGAQESGQKWRTETLEDHEYHMRNVAYRGILEAACVEKGFTLQKLRRRCVRKSSFKDFSEYKKDIFENYEFHRISSDGETSTTTSSSPNDEQTTEPANDHFSTALDSCYENYKHYFPLIEPLTGLQLVLQPVIEMMVQVDRLAYLKECGFSKVWLEKLFDPEVSPRNIALLAVR